MVSGGELQPQTQATALGAILEKREARGLLREGDK